MWFHLRDAFRAGDVWLARPRRYGDIRRTLLSVPAVPDADRSLPVPARPRDWLAERQFALADGLRRLAAKARAGASTGASIEDRILRVDRTEAAVPAADLVTDLYLRMPDARITDLLLEVDDATRFTEAFTHLRTGSPCRDRIGLLNVLLAEESNLGLRRRRRVPAGRPSVSASSPAAAPCPMKRTAGFGSPEGPLAGNPACRRPVGWNTSKGSWLRRVCLLRCRMPPGYQFLARSPGPLVRSAGSLELFSASRAIVERTQ